MTNSPRTVRDYVDEMSAAEAQPDVPANPALEANADELEARLTNSWNESFTVDPMIDKALKDVRDRARTVAAVVEDIEASRLEAKAGRADARKVESGVRQALETETKATKATIEAAQKALEVGRDRLVRELLPEPPRGTTSAEAKSDIALMIEGFDNADIGLRHAMKRAVETDDKVALGLLAGGYGEALHRARGGRPEVYAALRRELLAGVAEAAKRRSPKSTEARKWDVALGDAASTYLSGEGARALMRLQDVER